MNGAGINDIAFTVPPCNILHFIISMIVAFLIARINILSKIIQAKVKKDKLNKLLINIIDTINTIVSMYIACEIYDYLYFNEVFNNFKTLTFEMYMDATLIYLLTTPIILGHILKERDGMIQYIMLIALIAFLDQIIILVPIMGILLVIITKNKNMFKFTVIVVTPILSKLVTGHVELVILYIPSIIILLKELIKRMEQA